MNSYHTSVLLHETIEALFVKSGSQYIDGTLGGGGHAGEILKQGGIVLGIDQDREAIAYVEKNFQFPISNFQLQLVKGNFRDIDSIAKKYGFTKVSGILLDLGISSHHVDTPERGFSFLHEASLDMRMDADLTVTAMDLINGLTKNELTELFIKLGEERFARSIASAIVNTRKVQRIATTTELADVIRKSVPFTKKGIHPATKVFQALRIAVNDELHVLSEALPKALDLLMPGGRLIVISFHSLEDRIVKRSFIEFEEKALGKVITKKPIIPTDDEIVANSRSRSSKLRVLERIL